MEEEHEKLMETLLVKSKEKKESVGSTLAGSIMALGLSAMIGNLMLGGLSKMFGDSGDIKPRELVTAMIDGFMVYIDEWREKVKDKEKKIEQLEQELEMKKRHYEEAIELAGQNKEEVSKWKSKYMQMVSKSRKKPTVYGKKKK